MEITEWIAQTNQLLSAAEQRLPAAQVHQLRIFQQTLMFNHLQSGFLTLEPKTPLERAIASDPIVQAMAADPFKNIDFSQTVKPSTEPNQALKPHWSERVFVSDTEPARVSEPAPPPKDWSVLGR